MLCHAQLLSDVLATLSGELTLKAQPVLWAVLVPAACHNLARMISRAQTEKSSDWSYCC